MNLPDLSKWHEVPAGAYIDAGMPYVVAYRKATNHFEHKVATMTVRVDENDEFVFYTDEPIKRPLADVLRDAYLVDMDWDDVAAAAQTWFAKSQPETETFRDADGDYWFKAADGTWTIQEREGKVDYAGYSYVEMVCFAGKWGE